MYSNSTPKNTGPGNRKSKKPAAMTPAELKKRAQQKRRAGSK